MGKNSIQNYKESQYLKPLTTVFTITNIILGTGPIIIPPVFLLGGIGLSTIFILLIAFLSYIASEFIVESVSICNALTILKKYNYQQKQISSNTNLILESEKNVQIQNKNQISEKSIPIQAKIVTQISNIPTTNSLSSKNVENILQVKEQEQSDDEHGGSNQGGDFQLRSQGRPSYDDEQKDQQLGVEINSNEKYQGSNISSNQLIKTKKNQAQKKDVGLNIKDVNFQEDSIFSIKQIFECQELGQIIYGKTGKHIAASQVCTYLFGVIISKYIITAQTMAGVFEGVKYLETYSFWLGLFFVLCAIQSFMNLSDCKWVQNLIGYVRLVTILLFIGAPIYIIISTGKSYPITNFSYKYENNQTYDYKPFNFEAFSNLFSNLIFSFQIHHSLSSIISCNKPEKSIKKVIGVVYIISVIASLTIPIIGIKAFGGQLSNPYNTEQIVYYNNMFKESLSWIYYFTSFYIFLNVASLPVVSIVLKNNLLKWIIPKKQNEKIYNIGCTCIVLLIILLSAILFQNQIQTVISVIAGLSGVLIMIFLPSIFVVKGRQQIKYQIQLNQQYQQQIDDQEQQQKNQLQNNQNNIHKSILGFKLLPYLLIVLSVVIFLYNFYLIINKFLQ